MRNQRQQGWHLIQLGDIIAQRRGIWLRITRTHAEICGGREGDDILITIPLPKKESSELPTAEMWKSVYQQAQWHYDACLEDLLQMDDKELATTIREWLGTLSKMLAASYDEETDSG